MPIIRINRADNSIVGRVREKTDDDCIEVSDELFSRILGDPSAFAYDPATGQIDLVAGYDTAPPEHDPEVLAQFVATINQNVYVPELDVEVSISGDLGNHLLFALALAQYSPQTIVCNTKGRISTLVVDKAAAKLIAKAFSDSSSTLLKTLGVSDEPVD
ncbi:tail fiber protein [Erwinia phage pEa_SNUABM_32]|uniref:Uncharacterized protein n=2 Tax=Alexandravirus TaxID=2733088 RepID=A0AAE7XHB3_9CAUD|nr:tail fiber protein [Erwinia phage pEa_SNUABM_32]YP_010301217.1 tail fiber protein [Erwinia phage pEa_SNUABM_3]QZE56640.1 hypothetical protein pEaSNUABM20_00104 [Erwinia phage pEa_SNUABM_20]QZE58320.1 hypothetical protein pEaSNUABM40_00104 [Erwinia phage pEa_SNUABM_40]UAW52885.1 hypothetical protein pEaSNUABM23_00103 [Erwinia phage pEa_SNUABM_23]UIW10781.1 hypothetical protein pEaSNUABM23_00103 [Erwinia phage pEa_SNUABM_31]QZE56301.1 hypothetical protein pEaSNUABM3_00104 [Erwinia phage pEa_